MTNALIVSYNPQPPQVRKAIINLMVTGNETLYVPEDADVRLTFQTGTVDNISVLGTLTVAPQVSIDTGTDGELISAVKTLTSGATARGFALAATTQPYTVTGTKQIRIRKDVLGVGVATTFRARTDGVATLTFSAAPTGAAIGKEITVASVGGTGYNGVQIITAVTATTISYANAGADEASTADTAGRVGAYTALVTTVFA